MSAQNELAVVPPKEKALQVFQTPHGLDPYLKVVRDKIDAFVPDVTTRKGREAIASIAYTVARSKTALDNRGKELVAELKEIPKLIDAERKRMRDTLDNWQEEVRRPLNEWQAAEDARVEKHTDRIDWLRNRNDTLAELNSEQIRERIAEAEGIEIGPQWEEFEAEAAREKDKVLIELRAGLVKRDLFEAEQAELARHRAEAEARAQQEREAQIARDAEGRVRREAEAAAQAEREAVIRREADAKAAAERRELELKLQAEQAERSAAQAEANRIAAEQRAEQERIAAEQRQAEAVERARLAEIARANAAADEIIRQQNAREADLEHKKTINRAALEAFIAGGMTEECAKQAVTLIAQRKIPAVSISY